MHEINKDASPLTKTRKPPSYSPDSGKAENYLEVIHRDIKEMVQVVATLDEFNSVISSAKAEGKLVVVDFTASKCIRS